MEKFSWNKTNLLKNVKPWLPVMGELHYSRCPQDDWLKSIEKMKSGGINILSTYVFWNHHEKTQGLYNFSGQRNIRHFLELCSSAGIYVFLRIGPWSHGEVRHGGLPDWILEKSYTPRSNDKIYLKDVEIFWTRLYQECRGSMLQDGGPVIGLQIENEYGHAGGCGDDEHIRTLTQMAKNIGFNVPLYTATGWGGAYIGDLLPVMGGYCEAPWDQSTSALPPNDNYVFADERNDDSIGSDFGSGKNLTFDIRKYPYLTAELGGGLQVTYNRRPIVSGKDIGAMSLVKLGSGANLLGYYMYHGGINPDLNLQENRECGNYCDLPQLNYDFQAPIGAFGQIRDSYKEIKLLGMFLSEFGEDLCGMNPEIPSETAADASDFVTLRYCWRHNGKGGYLFVNNHQRQYTLPDHKNRTLSLTLPDETIQFEHISVQNGEYFIYPFNLQVGNGLLKTAKATPLCSINQNDCFFFTDGSPDYVWEKVPRDREIWTLSRKQAENSFKIKLDKEYLIICDFPVTEYKDYICIEGENDLEFSIYPQLDKVPDGFLYAGECAGFHQYKHIENLTENPAVIVNKTTENYLLKEYDLSLNIPKYCEDILLNIRYEGNIAEIWADDMLLMDDYYYGETFELGLKSFGFPKNLKLRIFTMEDSSPVYCDISPIMKNKRACRLNSIDAQGIYIHTIRL